MPRTAFDLETQLARHGGALRQLACALLGGDAADDAMQETWLRALQSPPRHAAGLGAWLAAILRNVALRGRRGEARRRRREAEVAAARASAAEDHAAVLARAELAHRLLAAVESLEPPFRDAIWQRWFEGRQPREIAAADGVPVATVKSRLQRGLGLLRERLGEREGADWRAGFAAAFGLGNEGAAAMVAAGGVLMATWTKVTAAIAAAAAIAAMAWWLRVPDVAPLARASAVGPAPAVSSDVAREAVPLQRDGAAADTMPPPPPVPAPPDSALAWRRGRVVDAVSKAPLGGVVVTWSGSRWPLPSDPRCVTDDDGRFDLATAADNGGEVWFAGEGSLMVRSPQAALAAGQQDVIGEIPLPRGRALRGRLVDDVGVPLPVGTVVRTTFAQSRGPGWQQYPWLEATVGIDGAFDLVPAVAFGPVTFELSGGEHTLAARVQVSEHEPTDLTLVATRRQQVRGVVVDDDGVPLAGVGVAIVPWEPSLHTAADGSFRLLRPDRYPPAVELHVRHAPAFVPVPPRLVSWGTTHLRIVLSRAGTVPIEVVDDAGAAVEQFGVVLERGGMAGEPRGTVLQRGTHAGGRLVVERAVPGQTSLRVVPVDPALTPSDVIPIANAETLRVVLARRLPCTIEVVRGGRAVADAHVQIAFLAAPVKAGHALPPLLDARGGPRAWLPGEDPELVAEGRTDARGIVQLVRDRDSGRGAVQVSCSGRQPFVVHDVTFAADGSALRIELPGVGTVAGRVQLRGRHRAQAAIVLQQGEKRPSVTPQPDGTFVSPPLLAGIWRVGISTIDGPADARDVEVRDGERSDVQLDVQACPPPASVRGRLVRNGPLPDGLAVDLIRLNVGTRPFAQSTAKVAADRTFAVDEVPAGTYRIAVRAGGSQLAMPALLADTFVLAVSEQLQLDVPLPPRRLVVRLHRADGSPAKGVKVLTRCDGAQWPSFGYFAAAVDEVMVFDPAPMLPVEFAAFGSTAPVWSAPVVMPPDRAEADVTVVLPDAR